MLHAAPGVDDSTATYGSPMWPGLVAIVSGVMAAAAPALDGEIALAALKKIAKTTASSPNFDFIE